MKKKLKDETRKPTTVSVKRGASGERLAPVGQHQLAQHSRSPVKIDTSEDRDWERSFADSTDILEQLANEALAEHRAGSTKPIDPDRM